MPFDIKEGLTTKLGPLPAWAYGLLAAGGFLAYRRFYGGNNSQATDTYGNPAADLAQTDPADVWPGGFGVGGSTGNFGNTGDPLDPSDNSGTPYPDAYAELLYQQQQQFSDLIGSLPQTWGLNDTPLNIVVSHEPQAAQNDTLNPQGNGAPPPPPTIDTRIGNDNPARVPSLQEFLASHPADNKTTAGQKRLTETWQRVFGSRYAAYSSASNGTVQAPVHALTGGGAPPPRVGVAPAVQPVQQARLNPATTNASGKGRQVGPWKTQAMRTAALVPVKASGKRVREFSTGPNAYYAEIFD